jgi:hypothetical protein
MPSAGVARPVCSHRNKLPAMACSGSMKTISQTVQVRRTRLMSRLYLSQRLRSTPHHSTKPALPHPTQ